MQMYSVIGGLDVNFVAARPFFVAGDMIQGNLSLTANGWVVIGCVLAEVICKAHAYDVYRIPGFSDEDGYTPEKNVVYPLVHQYLKTAPIVVFEARQTGGIALSATMVQPITFQIPVKEELPSTLTERTPITIDSASMSVEYTLKLTIIGMAGEVLKDKTFALDIRSLFRYPSPEKPLKVSRDVMLGFLWPSRAFTFYCVTDRTVYGPGDRIRLSYWYDAKNSENRLAITSVMVRLALSAKSHRPWKCLGQRNCPTEFVTKLITIQGSIPTAGKVVQYDIDVPMHVIPDFTLTGAPHPLHIMNQLSVVVGMSKTKCELFVPVVFNSLSSHHLAQFPYPVMQKPLPQKTSEAQVMHEKVSSAVALTNGSAAPTLIESSGPDSHFSSGNVSNGVTYSSVPTLKN